MLTILIQKEKHENLNYNLLFSSSSSSYLLALSVRIFLKTLANLVKYTLEKNSKKFPIFLRKKDKICGKNKRWSVRERLGKDVVFNLVPHFQEDSSLRMSSFLGYKGETMEGYSFH
jgi:hypothetical protein